MSRPDETKKLISNHWRRLQKLKEQAALFGVTSNPGILIEIEDIEAEIERLQMELKSLELQETILDGSNATAQKAFVEFNRQIETYLDKFNLLHKQLENWKNVHNTLQDIQFSFAFYRSYISMFDKPIEEKIFYGIEIQWIPCKRSFSKLKQWASSINQLQTEIDEAQRVIEQSDGLEGSSSSSQVSTIWKMANEIDKALNESNAITLPEHLSTFGDRIDQLLYMADKKLLDVVNEINHLPRPSFVQRDYNARL